MSRQFDYRKIDAFTAGDSLGNPAACLYLNKKEELSGADMLAVAKQHKGFVSEVVYCAPLPRGEFSLTYYSSECEVDFCGHGTVACMYGLIAETPALRNQKEITIHAARKGMLTVFNEIRERDAVYITAPAPQYRAAVIGAEEIAANLSLDVKKISAAQPVEIVNGGLETLIVPLAAFKDEIGVFPDEERLKRFCADRDIDIVLIYTLDTADPRHRAHTRVFAPKFGYLEDPATGSGNSAFGYYMLRHGLWDGGPVTVEQGGEDRVFNSVSLATVNPATGERRVLFGGSATVRIAGTYFL